MNMDTQGSKNKLGEIQATKTPIKLRSNHSRSTPSSKIKYTDADESSDSDSEYSNPSDDDFICYDDSEELMDNPPPITLHEWKEIKRRSESRWLKEYLVQNGPKN